MKIQRLLKLIGLLQSGRGYNVDSLSQECGVHRRTIFRDLEILRNSEVPLQFDNELQRYFIPGTYFLSPTNFTDKEAQAIIVLCNELGDTMRLPFYGDARTASTKLENSLSNRVRANLRKVTAAINIRFQPNNQLQGQKPVYEKLLVGILERISVRIRYKSPIEDEIQTRLSPYRLFFSRHSWYVIGRSTIHRGVRTFNVGRITHIEPTEESYNIPRNFSVERFLRNAWHMIAEPGKDCQVHIHFSPQVAQNVAEVNWHKTQKTQLNEDGSLDFRVTVSGLSEISWWILGYGDHAEVLEPKALRETIIDRAKKMLTLYDKK